MFQNGTFAHLNNVFALLANAMSDFLTEDAKSDIDRCKSATLQITLLVDFEGAYVPSLRLSRCFLRVSRCPRLVDTLQP
jgi:hypothetical protein